MTLEHHWAVRAWSPDLAGCGSIGVVSKKSGVPRAASQDTAISGNQLWCGGYPRRPGPPVDTWGQTSNFIGFKSDGTSFVCEKRELLEGRVVGTAVDEGPVGKVDLCES
jgi:hypothetical protein